MKYTLARLLKRYSVYYSSVSGFQLSHYIFMLYKVQHFGHSVYLFIVTGLLLSEHFHKNVWIRRF